jgi:hypothetical protein
MKRKYDVPETLEDDEGFLSEIGKVGASRDTQS